MNDAVIISLLLGMSVVALVVCVRVGRSIFREWNGDETDEKIIRKELERWRDGR